MVTLLFVYAFVGSYVVGPLGEFSAEITGMSSVPMLFIVRKAIRVILIE